MNKFFIEKNIDFEYKVFKNGLDFVESFQSNYDVIFFDIELPIMNGMEASKKIRNIDHNVEIIFVTRLNNYAIDGYLVNAFDYVLKPINYTSFALKLDRLIKSYSNEFSSANFNEIMLAMGFDEGWKSEVL